MSVCIATKSSLCDSKRRLLNYFEDQGLPYMVARIDRDSVLYRHLNNYDIEIRGGYDGDPFYVYVWALQGKRHPMYTVADYSIHSKNISAAAAQIHAIAEEYIRRPAHELQ